MPNLKIIFSNSDDFFYFISISGALWIYKLLFFQMITTIFTVNFLYYFCERFDTLKSK